MPRLPTSRRTASVGFALAAAASVLVLSACASTEQPPGERTDPGGPVETTPPAATDAPEATPEETVEPAIPFAIDCEQLVTLDQMYAFNPNYGSAPEYAPSNGDVAVIAIDEQGTACGWLNQTSGDVIEIAVATPPADRLETATNAAALRSQAVPTYGTPPAVAGYFDVEAGSGIVQLFTGDYWVVMTSPAFVEPGDAQQLAASVLQNITAE